jgi:hypothetical protein
MMIEPVFLECGKLLYTAARSLLRHNTHVNSIGNHQGNVDDELLAMTTDLEGERRKSSGYDEEIALGKHFQGFYFLLLRKYIHT